MAIYSVISKQPQPSIDAAIRANFPADHIQWSDRIHFVASGETPKDVALKLGVRTRPDGPNPQGADQTVVVAISPSYFGWTGTDFWEWLKATFQKEG